MSGELDARRLASKLRAAHGASPTRVVLDDLRPAEPPGLTLGPRAKEHEND